MKGNYSIIGVIVGDEDQHSYLGGEIRNKSVDWHLVNVGYGDYITACGQDGNDPAVGQFRVKLPERGQKVTCATCYALWKGFKSLTVREVNFDESVKP